jgi:hypothetical protein
MTDQTTGVRVLFSGQYWPGANTLYIARAFERCGAIVRFHNDTTLWPGWTSRPGRTVRRLLRRWIIEPEWNRQLLALVDDFKPDLVYVTNADFCWPKTLQAIRQRSIPLMSMYHDPQWNRRPGSLFSRNLPYFDLIATPRRWQADEFTTAGARAVLVTRFGYEPLVHRPMQANELAYRKYGADVTFIATYEHQRAVELTTLIEKGFPWQFRLWGGYWDQLPTHSPVRRYWQNRHIHEQEIPVIYATSKIALHWINREPGSLDEALRRGDQHNSRTFQIAACGRALMIAQRTEEHLQFFQEDAEAVYFGDVNELREKLIYWLEPARAVARREIAAAAHARCVREDYSYVPVVRRYLQHFGLPIAAGTTA